LRKKPAELNDFCPLKAAQKPLESTNSLLIPCSAGNFPPRDWFAIDSVIRHGVCDFHRFSGGRNPATGEAIKISALTRLRFTVAKALKDMVLGAK
jgi:hypothetical protein